MIRWREAGERTNNSGLCLVDEKTFCQAESWLDVEYLQILYVPDNKMIFNTFLPGQTPFTVLQIQ